MSCKYGGAVMSNKTNQKDSSSKTKVIVGIIIAILVLAIIGSGLFVLKKRTPKSEESVTISNSSDFIVKDVQFKDKSLNLKVGETVTLDIVVEPDSIKTDDIEFKSNDSAVAKVDVNGKITGFAPGSTTVTATLKSDSTIMSTINVKVINDTDTAETKSVIDSSTDKNSDTDTTVSKKQSDKNSDFDTKKKETSSTVTSKNPDNNKNSVSSTVNSNVSKVEETSTSTRVSQPDNSTNNNQSKDESSQNTEVSSKTDNTPSEKEENTSSTTVTTPNNTSEFIDPNSVGKSIPISFVGTDEKKVSISFDASWGNENTQSILDTLDQYDVKTTFFLVGIWVRAYPDDVKKIAQAGHDIGNHSNTHPDLTQLDMASIKYEMETCSNDIEALTGFRPTLFRNPYGAYDNRVIGTALGMGMDCIQWDVDTLDWTNNSGSEICARIRNNIKNGSIILMHNAGGSTADSLPMIIQTIRDLGYEIVPISELLPDGGYTTDYSGRAIPIDPPENESSDDSESTISENNQSQNSDSSDDTNVDNSDSSSNTSSEN